jgi:hypothetical protein
MNRAEHSRAINELLMQHPNSRATLNRMMNDRKSVIYHKLVGQSPAHTSNFRLALSNLRNNQNRSAATRKRARPY